MAKKKATTRRRKTRTIVVDEFVLAIDSNDEPVARAAYLYREKHVYPYMQSKGYTIVRCQGALARRSYVAPQARKGNVVYLTGAGHGSHTTYKGHYYEPIFQVGNFSTEESDNKIVHFLSCQTGRDLGPDFVAHGCRAYFGYDEDFVFIMEDSEVFFECDSEIDRAFADGLTARQVYTRVNALYQLRIGKLLATGKLYTAATLETNLDRLRCPSSGGAVWGNVNSRL